MNELSTQIEREVSKLQTMHALTQHRGLTETEAKQQKAIMDMAYISALGTLANRLKMTSQCFKGKSYLKEIQEYASELYIEGRNKSTCSVAIATRGIGQAYLDVATAIKHTVNQR